MKKAVVFLLASLVVVLGGCGKSEFRQKATERAAHNSSYGIRSADGKILFELISKTSLVFHGVKISPSHAAVTELHSRLSTKHGMYDVPEQLNPDFLSRDKSEGGSIYTFFTFIEYNELDKRLKISFISTSPDNSSGLRANKELGFPKTASLNTQCEGMTVDECSRAIAKEVIDFALPDFERLKARLGN